VEPIPYPGAVAWLAGVLLFVLHPTRRSLKSLVYVMVTVAIGFLVLALGAPYWAVAGCLAIVWLAGLLDLRDVLAPMNSRDRKFYRQVRSIRATVAASVMGLSLEDWDQRSGDHVDLLQAQLRRTNDLRSPDEHWDQLRRAMVKAIEFDIDVFTAGRPMTGATGNASAARWEALDRLTVRVVAEHRNPWTMS
jgi:hypothetical protein